MSKLSPAIEIDRRAAYIKAHDQHVAGSHYTHSTISDAPAPREAWKPIKPTTPRGKRRAKRRALLDYRYKASWFSTIGDKTGYPDHRTEPDLVNVLDRIK